MDNELLDGYKRLKSSGLDFENGVFVIFYTENNKPNA